MSAKKVRKGYTIVGPNDPVRYGGMQYGQYTVPRQSLTSPVEIRDMLAAIAILTVAFSLVFFSGDFVANMGFALVIVVGGFFFHEMA
ncbi:MAG: hypothetical protein JW880_07460, partial [Candidatus Thermoplasmatota archaeon]|nr:hypothetical protein [Candidatus Thermoplasmatota archaeon]